MPTFLKGAASMASGGFCEISHQLRAKSPSATRYPFAKVGISFASLSYFANVGIRSLQLSYFANVGIRSLSSNLPTCEVVTSAHLFCEVPNALAQIPFPCSLFRLRRSAPRLLTIALPHRDHSLHQGDGLLCSRSGF